MKTLAILQSGNLRQDGESRSLALDMVSGPFKTYGKQAFLPNTPGRTLAEINDAADREG
jgi:hypothetical protein